MGDGERYGEGSVGGTCDDGEGENGEWRMEWRI